AVGAELPFEHALGEALAVEPGQGVAAGLHLIADDAASGLLGGGEATRPESLDQRRLAGTGTAGEDEKAVAARHDSCPLKWMSPARSRARNQDERMQGSGGFCCQVPPNPAWRG